MDMMLRLTELKAALVKYSDDYAQKRNGAPEIMAEVRDDVDMLDSVIEDIQSTRRALVSLHDSPASLYNTIHRLMFEDSPEEALVRALHGYVPESSVLGAVIMDKLSELGYTVARKVPE